MWLSLVVAIIGLVLNVLRLLFGMEKSGERLTARQSQKLGELFAKVDQLKAQAVKVGYAPARGMKRAKR